MGEFCHGLNRARAPSLMPAPVAGAIDSLRPYGFLLIYALMFTGILSAIVIPPYYFLLAWLR